MKTIEITKRSRHFLGKISDFDSKEEQRFEQAHLKAYKRGDKRFRYGKEEIRNSFGLPELVDRWYDVREEWS